MKRITLLFSFVFISLIAFGQNVYYSPEDLEKMKMERELMREKEQSRGSIDHMKLPGFSFTRDGECPEGTFESNPPDGGTAYTSSTDAQIINYQSFSGLGEQIGGVSFWAIQGFFDGGWTECSSDIMDVEVIFYEDDGGLPGDVVHSEVIAFEPVADPDVGFGTWTVKSFTAYLGSPVAMTSGWFSFAATNSPSCWILILNSETGSGAAGYYDNGVWTPRDYPTNYCLLAPLADDEAPAAPTSFVVEAGEMGAFEATVSWVNPVETFSGDDLVSLDEIRLYRNGELIFTLEDPEIGAAASYEDTDIDEPGIYNYLAYGVNEAGEGLSASASAYVGEDVPAAPGNLILMPEGNDGHVSWDAPTAGLNGGYLSGDNLVYTVVRMPDETTVAEDIEETEFLDTTVPGIGNYFYMVTASNHIGVGGTAASNVELLAAEGILMYEVFDYPTGAIPPGWAVQGIGAGNWSVHNSSTAGGDAPQMRLTWSPIFDGLSRLVSPPINTDGHEELRLKLKQFLSNFSVAANTIAIQVSFDEGESWEDLWSETITGSIPAQDVELYIDVPSGKTIMHLGFEFEGDSNGINWWDFDNIILEPVLENDLVGVSISGNTTPSAGIETIYTVMVQNAGTETQSDYTVKLMGEGGVELASVPGETIEFAETLSFELAWTPMEEGATYVYGYVDFPADEMPGNNQTPNLNINVQPGDIMAVTIGDGDLLTTSPYNFVWHYSLQQTLYYPEEIGMGGGIITGIQYTNSFNEAQPQRQITVWLGETNMDDLSGGWVDPSTLELVFDGLVDFPAGENEIFIPFDTPYVYGGGTLVIYNYKQDNVWTSGKNFYNTPTPGVNRTRLAQQDNNPYDPANPPAGGTAARFPNITMYFSTAGLGSLAGTVENEAGDPLAGVTISIDDTNISTTSNADGEFEFPYLTAGDYSYTASLIGYFDATGEFTITEDEETTVEIVMLPLEHVTVSGFVASDQDPEVGVEGAIVQLTGYAEFETTTDEDGMFTIEEVYANQSYMIHVEYLSHLPYMAELEVGTEDVELDILLEYTDIIEVVIGDGEVLDHQPFNFFFRYSVVQTLYYPEEIGLGGGVISGLQYANSFQSAYPDTDIMIFIGETDVDDLTGGWVDFESLQLVYDNAYDFPAGQNDLYFPLDDLYIYGGGNLVIYTVKAFPEWQSGNQFYNTTDAGSNRTRRAQNDSAPYDPMNPGVAGLTNNNFPNITVSISVAGLGALEGTVTENGEPVDGVHVQLLGTNFTAATNEDGFYQFPYLLPGTYDIEFSKFGYYTEVVEEVVLEADETTVLDAEMEALPTVAVYGTVVGSDLPEVGIVSATVTLVGYDNYATVTDEDGMFMIEGVYADHVYMLTVQAAGYTTYTDEVAVGTEDLDLGTIIVEEIAYPVVNVQAEIQEDETVLVSWELPGEGEEWFEGFEDDFPPLGWIKLNPDGGTGWEQLAVGTTPLPGWNGGEAFPAPDGESYMAFVSYEGGGAVMNDQWLVTPQLTASAGFELSFYLRYWPDTYDDYVEILISTTVQDNPDAFNIVVDELSFGVGSSTEWELYSYNITDFISAGQPFYLAFREHVTDNWAEGAAIMLDNVYHGPSIKRPVPEPLAKTGSIAVERMPRDPDYVVPAGHKNDSRVLETFNVYRFLAEEQHDEDAWDELAVGLTQLNYTDEAWEALEAGVYKYAVIAVYTNDVLSPPAFSNTLAKDMTVPLTLNVTTNSGDAPTGATVHLINMDDPQYEYEAVVPPTGIVDFLHIWRGHYALTIELEGFETYYAEDIDITQAAEYDAELIELIIAPYALNVTTFGLPIGDALLTWNTGVEGEFRYDDGVVDNQLGFTGTLNSVMGAAHHRDAELHEISWYLTDEGGPYATVKLWVLGLTDEGTPDRNNIIYTAENVPNQHEVWNSYTLSEVLSLPDGFFIGVSATGFLGLATDNGVGEPWDFVPGTQFGVFNITDPTSPFNDIAVWDFHVNFLLRGYGLDFGPVDYGKGVVSRKEVTKEGPAPITGTAIGLPYDSGTPEFLTAGIEASKAFLGYNVFLDDDQVATEIMETEYLFTGLEDGHYVAGVQSVYTTGTSDIITEGFFIGEVFYDVTFNVDMSDVEGFDPEEHTVYLTGSFTDWAEPGTEGSIVMTSVDAPPAPILYEAFLDGEIPAGWIVLDEDGNGQTWFIVPENHDPIEGDYAIASASWMPPNNPLTPDNWLITPQITNVQEDYVLSFYVKAQDPAWPQEKYDVLISTTGTDPDDFTSVWSETLSDGVWHERSLELSDFEGEDIYIAFRHWDSTDWFRIVLDVIKVEGSPASKENGLHYSATVSIAEGIHEYLYYSDAFGEGFDGAEWEDEHYRELTVTSDKEVFDIWGVDPDAPEPPPIESLPYFEDFTGIANGELPNNWLRTHTNWGVWNTNNAGGESAPELRFHWTPNVTDVFRAITPLMDATTVDEVFLSFMHSVQDFSGDYTLKVQTSPDGEAWETHWELYIAAKGGAPAERTENTIRAVPPTAVTIDLSELAGEMFHVAFVFEGTSWDTDGWFIDDISISDEPAFVFYTVTFDVFDEDGFPVDHAVITLGDMVNEPGDYVFHGVPGGMHEFTVSALCFHDHSAEIMVDHDVEHEITLDFNIMLGDANGDGQIDVNDIIAIALYYIGTPEDFCLHNADVNGDGVVNILDVIGILNMMSKGEIGPYQAMESDDAHIYMGEHGIMLHSDGTLTGIQFELTGDVSGLELKLELPNHEIVYVNEDGVLRVIIFSMNNTPIPAGLTDLVSFNRSASAEWLNAMAGNLNADEVPVIIHYDEITGIDDVVDVSFNAYPNPASDVIYVDLSGVTKANISLINVHGQIVETQSIDGDQQVRFDIGNLPAGMYLIRLDHNNQAIIERIMVK